MSITIGVTIAEQEAAARAIGTGISRRAKIFRPLHCGRRGRQAEPKPIEHISYRNAEIRRFRWRNERALPHRQSNCNQASA